jgi:hypothetical protein
VAMPLESRSLAAPRIIVGTFLVLMGLAWILEQLGVVPAHYVERFWPAVLIALGLALLLRGRRQGSVTGLVLIVVGSWLLLNTLGVVMSEPWEFIGPLVLLAIGARLVTGRPGNARWRHHHIDGSGSSRSPSDAYAISDSSPANNPSAQSQSTDDISDRATFFVLLSSNRRRWGRTIFRSAEATCVMGGCELDLRDALLGADGTAQIDVFILMGGLKLSVPPTWTVMTDVVPVMGGVDDKTRSVPSATTQYLLIRGTLVMGGVEVSN